MATDRGLDAVLYRSENREPSVAINVQGFDYDRSQHSNGTTLLIKDVTAEDLRELAAGLLDIAEGLGTSRDVKPTQEPASPIVDLVSALREAVDAARKRRLAERDCPGCDQNGTGLENHRRDCERNPANN
jgi:hypothetical protein